MFRATAAGAAAPATASASVSTAVGGLSAQAAVFAAVIGGLVEGASRSGKADDLMASLEDAQSRVLRARESCSPSGCKAVSLRPGASLLAFRIRPRCCRQSCVCRAVRRGRSGALGSHPRPRRQCC